MIEVAGRRTADTAGRRLGPVPHTAVGAGDTRRHAAAHGTPGVRTTSPSRSDRTTMSTNPPTNPPSSPSDGPATGPERRRSLLARWGRLLDGIRPAGDADRLVRVAEVSRGTLPMAEGSLADMAMAPVIQETRTTNGETRFTVLVPARDAEAAREALSGL
jgi:hypothetical protein